MPRPRAASLSPFPSRTSTSPSLSPPPPAMSIRSLMTTNKLVRYSPYQTSRMSFSSTTWGSGDEATSGSESVVYLGRRSSISSIISTEKTSTPITARMSRLGLSKPLSPPLAQPRPRTIARPTHRRTQSLATPPSYGFLLHPQAKPSLPAIPRRHSEISPRSPSFRAPSPTVARVTPAPTTADQLNVPLTPTRRASFDRMMLVNPAIAAHLRRGGAVNMRTPDGGKRWRVRLQREGGALAGVMEEAERLSPTVM